MAFPQRIHLSLDAYGLGCLNRVLWHSAFYDTYHLMTDGSYSSYANEVMSLLALTLYLTKLYLLPYCFALLNKYVTKNFGASNGNSGTSDAKSQKRRHAATNL